MNREERMAYQLHNEQVRRGNTPPAGIPEPPNDLEGMIVEYNVCEAAQRARLGAIWSAMAARKGSNRFIAFGNAHRWTVNDFRTSGDRDDLHLGRSLESFVAPITEFDLGEV